jgi:hypothetical protein
MMITTNSSISVNPFWPLQAFLKFFISFSPPFLYDLSVSLFFASSCLLAPPSLSNTGFLLAVFPNTKCSSAFRRQRALHLSIKAATQPSVLNLWLCAPAFRQVCPFRLRILFLTATPPPSSLTKSPPETPPQSCGTILYHNLHQPVKHKPPGFPRENISMVSQNTLRHYG